MAYCTTEDLRALLSDETLLRLADDSGTAASLLEPAVSSVIASAIANADKEIDMAVSGRYVVPVSPVPVTLATLSSRIAVYYLMMRRDRPMDEKWSESYKQAIGTLSQIRTGEIFMDAPTASAAKPTPAIVPIDSMFGKRKVF
jgi:phage gp36-like protein